MPASNAMTRVAGRRERPRRRAARHLALRLGLAALLGAAAAARLLLAFAVPLVAEVPGAVEPPDAPPEVASAVAERDDRAVAAFSAALGFGALDVHVLHSGAPVDGAEVRVYARAAAERGTGLPVWQLSGTSTTGPDGLASRPTLPGSHLVAVRAPGLAPAHVVVERPRGEPRTRVTLSLVAAVEVSGRVVARRDGEPVPLATVTLVARDGARDPGPDLPPDERAYATADPSGQFRLSAAPGRHLLEATAVGFTRARLPLVAPQANVEIRLAPAAVIEGFVRRPDGTPAAGAEVTLAGGEQLTRASTGAPGGFAAEVTPGTYVVTARDDRSAGAWALPVTVAAGERARGLEIWLGPPAAIAGFVASEDGEPVAGASVLVTAHESPGEVARASTDAGGRFEVEGLGAASYDVAVAADGWSPAQRRGTVLVAGERVELTVVLERCGGLAGTVRDAAGRPAAGALVRATPLRADGVSALATRSDASGAYALSGLEPAWLEVAAVPEGAAGGASVTVQIAPGAVARADLTLAETGWLEGLVSRRDRGPVERAWVVALPHAYPAAGGGPVVAEVGADGRYAMRLAAGEYRAFATFAAPAEGAPVLARGPAVRVAPGQTMRLDLDVGPEAGGPSALVQVLEPSGAPSPGALVSITASDDLRSAGSGVTDEDGFARIDLEERGELLVRAVRAGRLAGPAPLAASGPTVLALPAGASLVGRVATHDGRSPAGFTLEVAVLGDDAAAVSTLGGRAGPKLAWGVDSPRRLHFGGDGFEVPDAPSGRLRVTARSSRGQTAHVDVQLAPGEQRRLDLVLPADGALAGRAVDARTGAPIAGAAVALVVGGRAAPRPDATTGPDGRFRLDGLRAGMWKLRLAAPGYAPAEREADPAGESGGDLGEVTLARALDAAAAAR